MLAYRGGVIWSDWDKAESTVQFDFIANKADIAYVAELDNTLDFSMENRVPTGRFHPYWKPRSQGTCSPFTIPDAFTRLWPQTEKWVCEHRSINAKISQPILRKEEERLWDFHYAAFIGTGEIHASRIAVAKNGGA